MKGEVLDSRRLIKRVINFDGARRIGFNLPAPWPCDLVHVEVGADPAFEERRWLDGETEYWVDEWGCTWRRLGGISKGEVFEGAIKGWGELEDYRPPDFGIEERYEEARRVFAEAGDRYCIGEIPGCAFNISRKIRRLDNFLADCLLEPERVRELNGIVMDELEKAVRHFAGAGAHGVMFPEDWGTQDRLLMAPETFRELFLAEFERLCGVAADAGVDVWMHSCGYIWEIIDDLIGAGIKVLQFDQPSLYGIEKLGEAFSGRVTFECPVDIQRTLQTRDRDTIRAEAKRLVEVLGANGGGFIATRYPDEAAIGLEPKWQDIACEAFVEFGSERRQR